MNGLRLARTYWRAVCSATPPPALASGIKLRHTSSDRMLSQLHRVGAGDHLRELMARWRKKTAPRNTACFVRRPVTRFRHILKEEGFMCPRIKSMTADSSKPNWASIASKAVRSSHAISTMREMLLSDRTKASSARSFLELVIAHYDNPEG